MEAIKTTRTTTTVPTTSTTTTVPTTSTTTTIPTTRTTTTVPTTSTTTTIPTTSTTTTVPTTSTTTTVPTTSTTTTVPTTSTTTTVPTTSTTTTRKTPALINSSNSSSTGCIPTEKNNSHFKNVANFFGQQYRNFSEQQHSERTKEYIETLQHNLNHPCVEKIHLFYAKEEDLKTLTDSHLENFQKLQPVKHERALHMADFYIYSSKHLIGKPVVAVNGDIQLEEGFEKIDVQKMLDNKFLYSLSRYERKDGCNSGKDMCTSGYGGSHDCHIFALAKPLNESLLMEKLDFPINMYQSENGMIYNMRTVFNFTVTNPCYDVKIYHHHCSKVHGPPNGSAYSILSLGFLWKNVLEGFARPTTL